jgi:25S rRNA (cytosine2870-C5)-methyltransferase
MHTPTKPVRGPPSLFLVCFDLVAVTMVPSRRRRKGGPPPPSSNKKSEGKKAKEEDEKNSSEDVAPNKQGSKQQKQKHPVVKNKQKAIVQSKPTTRQQQQPQPPKRAPPANKNLPNNKSKKVQRKDSYSSESEEEEEDSASSASEEKPLPTSNAPAGSKSARSNRSSGQQRAGSAKRSQVEEEDEEEQEDDDDDDDDEDHDENSESGSDEGSEHEEEDEEAADMPAFSDQNASWLKPKKSKSNNLLESDEDEDDDDDDELLVQDEGSDEDDEDLLEVEREARLMDQELEEEQMEADMEMRDTIRDHTSVYHLPTPEELEGNVDRVVPPSEIRGHIESILEVLTEFRDRREPGRARKEYLDVLGMYLAELHGYLPELINYYLTMFGPAETVEFVAQSDKTRPLVIRTNTLKTRRKDLAAALMKRGVSLDPLGSWSKVGLVISESPVPIGATPEYLCGHYMLQSAASMCAVVALSPQPNDKVLDLSSAPGGKTTYLSQLMRNTGVVVANDLKAERQKATVANVHRLGVRNVVACQHDGRKLGTLFRNRFDRVLLDAPCSGLGVASRDPSVKVQRTLADVHKCAHLQKELLLSAIDALKFRGTSGGIMVYSTCSVSVAENEEVVQYALSKRDIKIVDAGLDVGKPGFTRFQERRFHPSMALARRFYPHVHNMDGFFVAKIQKLSDGRPGLDKPAQGDEEAVENDEPVEDEEKDLIDEEANKDARRVKKAAASSKAMNKKRKRKGNDKVDAEKPKKVKNPLVSVPPVKPKSKKPKTQNAKVSKPRRSRSATDA